MGAITLCWKEDQLCYIVNCSDYYCVVGIVVDVVVDIMAGLTPGDVEFIGEVLPKFRQAIMGLNLNS